MSTYKDEGTPTQEEIQEFSVFDENEIPEVMDNWLEEQHALEAQLSSECDICEEPETVKVWREEQRKRVEEKDKLERAEMEKLREHARSELEEFYKNYNAELERIKIASKVRQEQVEKYADGDGACVEAGKWDRIAKYCDLTVKPKTGNKKDTSRMRSIIIQLKNEPKTILN